MCNFPYSEYKGVIHRGSCGFQENKKSTISQGDVIVFGQNAGQQYVPMSLCVLIYHNIKKIGNPDALKQIMHIGSKLYGSLSQLSRQSFLLLADLP